MRLESSVGIILGLSAIVAILFKNSKLDIYYDALINFILSFSILGFSFSKTMILWVNDFLMTFFFLMVGLELKREFKNGHLSNHKHIILPAVAALGGLIFPSIIYISFNYCHPEALRGWAIPAATDIAFAMGILALIGNKIPKSLKICLLSLAIFDDIAAIMIIAAFYTQKISMFWIVVSVFPILVLFLLNYNNINIIILYILTGMILWLCILKSGIHATIAGILLALFIPHSSKQNSALIKLEYQLHPYVSFLILPIFAFFNAGVSLKDLSISAILHPIAAGIAIGLFIGKQLGVMLFSYCAIKCKICILPHHTSWYQFYGMAVVTGVGFTMSLFIGGLSFSQHEYQNLMKLGVVSGSTLSGIIGYMLLLYSCRRSYD